MLFVRVTQGRHSMNRHRIGKRKFVAQLHVDLNRKTLILSIRKTGELAKIDNVKSSPERQVKARPFLRPVLACLCGFAVQTSAGEEPALNIPVSSLLVLSVKISPPNGFDVFLSDHRRGWIETFWKPPQFPSRQDKGKIDIGMRADFTVLSADIMKIPEPEILKTRSVMTVIAGEIVYQR
jgi:hypothetical protein